MSREIYVPIADAFFESSIMREELPVRFVMLALIRLGLRPGARGVIDMDPVIFAQSINIPYPDVERAIKRLMEPDPASGCPDEDGRRIVPTNPARPFRGWRLVNWGRYKDIVHRANDAARKRDERSHEEDDNTDDTDTSTPVRKRPTVSENGATKTKTNTNTKTKKKENALRAFVVPSVEEVRAYLAEKGYGFDPESFVAFYASKGWKVGTVPMKDWRAACVTWQKRNPEPVKGPRGNILHNAEAERMQLDWEVAESMQAEMEKRPPRPYPHRGSR